MLDALRAARIGRVLAAPSGAVFDDDDLVNAIDRVSRAASTRDAWISSNRAAYVASTTARAAVVTVDRLRASRAPVSAILTAESRSRLLALTAERAAVDARAAARRLAAVVARAHERVLHGF